MKGVGISLWPKALVLLYCALSISAPAEVEAANQAEIQVAASTVPASIAEGSTAPIVVRVRNTGTTTWTRAALYRLGAAGGANQVLWSGYGCGGYANSPGDARVELCHDVPPGATYDFHFQITAPTAPGSTTLAVRMVRDGFEWFGASQSWNISIGDASPLPDVVVESVSVHPPQPAAGQAVTFSAIVRNAGSAATPGDKVIGVGYRIDGAQKTWGVVSGPLAPGASVTIGTQGGAWSATAGAHTLTAVADDVNRFTESNEGNNALSSSFSVASSTLPDVVVESVSVHPAQPAAGQAVTFSAVVRNAGSAPTPSGSVIGVGYRIDGAQKTWGAVAGPLTPGASVTIGTQGGAWTAAAGAHTLTAVADDVNRFTESNEGNNSLSASFSVAASSLPDVVVESVTLHPAEPLFGEAVTFTAVVRNVGSAATPSGKAIGVGYRIDGAQKTWGSVSGPLAPGASVTIGTHGGAWSATAGAHTLTAVADDVNRFTESDETNNARSVPFQVQVTEELAGLFGMNIDPANPKGNPSAAELKAIGVRWLRVEWKVTHGFDFYDPILAAYRAAGLEVLLLLDYSTVPDKPASTAGDAEWNAYRARFRAGVEEVVSHYRDTVDAWQVWNEPDLFHPGTAYDPGVPAHQYGLMLREAAEIIRRHSTRPIIGGSIATANPDYLVAARNAAGSLDLDAIAIHPYGRRAPDGWPHASWGFGDMSELFDRFAVFNLPIWVTEIGTRDTPIQGQYLENVYELVRDEYLDRVPVVFWFCWSDGMVSPMGVVDWDGNPKDAYHRYRGVAPPW